jgi:hypothetical protein
MGLFDFHAGLSFAERRGGDAWLKDESKGAYFKCLRKGVFDAQTVFGVFGFVGGVRPVDGCDPGVGACVDVQAGECAFCVS